MAEKITSFITWLKKVMELSGVKEGVVMSIITIAAGLANIPLEIFGVSIFGWFCGIIITMVAIRVILFMILDTITTAKKKIKGIKEVNAVVP